MLNQNDTSGFYSNNGGLLCAPNFVDAPTYQLNRGDKDTYTYPVNGWYWFDSIEEAANFFGIELPKEEENKGEQNYF
jgi:hypothetical protein